jgi:GNAT superfamily N-acetyltransferase
MYVNCAIAVGHDRPPAPSEFSRLESRSAAVGVGAAIEVTPATAPATRATAEGRGYVRAGSVAALRRRLDDVDELPLDEALVIEPASAMVSVWQETSAAGWGRTTTAARRASDAFAAAAAVADGDGFVVARDAIDGRLVGCATMSVSDGVATLAGMSTIPTERGRGVQRALIHHRLRLARDAGCDVATSTASPGGASERNLRRHGFQPWFEIDTLVRPGRVS